MSKFLSAIFVAGLIALSSGCSDGAGGEHTEQAQGLSAEVKVAFGADPNKSDTDGDGLTDEFEIGAYPFLKPDSKDTNNNGVGDADEDTDSDGLTNIQEQQYKTHPLMADSDGDGLSDKDEIFVYKTDPNNKDTDGDGVIDGREVANISDPLKKDADKVVTSSNSISVVGRDGVTETVGISIVGNGDLAKDIIISSEKISNSIGVVSKYYDIRLKSGVSSVNANVIIPFDKSDANAVDVSKLAVFTINPVTGAYEQLPGSVDINSGTINATTTHFSPFFVANKDVFAEFLNSAPQTCDLVGDPNAKPADVVLVIDSSGSMQYNDPGNIRKSAAKSFASKMKGTDRVAVVDFDGYSRLAIGLSSDISSINAAIDTIDSDGATDIGAGVSTALRQLTSNSDASKNRAIILLTDGDGSYSTSLTTQLANSGIRVFAVGLTGAVNTALLQGIATSTNGGYKQIQTADGINNIFTEFSSVFGDTGKDTDGDGLTDCQETQGILVQGITIGSDGKAVLGKVITSNPNKKDTDDDGLEDGFEIGAVYRVSLASNNPWATKNFISDPNIPDTDGDGLSDFEEVAEGTNPLNYSSDSDGISDGVELANGTDPWLMDTDGDGFSDNTDENPTIFDEKASKLSLASGFVVGYLCPGDWDYCTNSLPKVSGKIANTFTPVVGNAYDVANAIVNTLRLDFLSAGVDMVGVAANLGYIVPPVGVGTDTLANITKAGKVVIKYSKVSVDGAVVATKNLAKIVPTSLADDVLGIINPAAFSAMKNAGISDEAIGTLAKSGKVNFDHLKIALDGAKKPYSIGGGFLSDWRKAEDIVRGGKPKYGKAVDVPDGTKRYPDDFDPNTAIAKEAKNGCEDSSRVLRQIEKDAALKTAGTYKSIEWHFFPSAISGCIGPGPKVMAALVEKGIPYIMHLP